MLLTPEFLIDNDIVREIPASEMWIKVRAASRSVNCPNGLVFSAGKKYVSVRSGFPSEPGIPDYDLPALLVSTLAHLPNASSSGIKVKPESQLVGVDEQGAGLPRFKDEPDDLVSKVAFFVRTDHTKLYFRESKPARLKLARKYDDSRLRYYKVSTTYRHHFSKPLAYDSDAAGLMKRHYMQDLKKYYKGLERLSFVLFYTTEGITHWQKLADSQKGELLEELDTLDEYADEMGINRPQPKLQAAVREMVLKLWKARPEDYSVAPRADGSISISASLGMDHSLAILCKADHSVACFLSRDGHNSQAHYDSIHNMPLSFLWEAMAPLQNKSDPQRTGHE